MHVPTSARCTDGREAAAQYLEIGGLCGHHLIAIGKRVDKLAPHRLGQNVRRLDLLLRCPLHQLIAHVLHRHLRADRSVSRRSKSGEGGKGRHASAVPTSTSVSDFMFVSRRCLRGRRKKFRGIPLRRTAHDAKPVELAAPLGSTATCAHARLEEAEAALVASRYRRAWQPVCGTSPRMLQ